MDTSNLIFWIVCEIYTKCKPTQTLSMKGRNNKPKHSQSFTHTQNNSTKSETNITGKQLEYT